MKSSMQFCDFCLHRVIPLICLLVCAYQIADCVIKYIDAPTTTSKKPVLNKDQAVDPPHFTICADPNIKETPTKELGHELNLWSMFHHANSNPKFSTWPIKDPIKDLRLYEKTTFGLDEVLQYFKFGFEENLTEYKRFSDQFKEKYLQIQELDTYYNGRCFTFKPQGFKLQRDEFVSISLKNIWINTTTSGRFTIYVHDQGLEFNIMTQVWYGSEPFISEIEPERILLTKSLPGVGKAVELVLTKYIEKSVPINKNGPDKFSTTCKDWSSTDMTSCIEQILLQNRTFIECRLPMTLLRGNLTDQGVPLCNSPTTAWNVYKNEHSVVLNSRIIRIDKQGKIWNLLSNCNSSGKCPPPCEAVLYDGKVRTYKTGSNEMAPIWISRSSSTVMIQEEYPLYDFGTVVAAVGGNLGLFIGLSVLGLIQFCIKKLMCLPKRKIGTICS